MIPEGYKVVRVGWEREHIGYKSAPGPGREDYKPMTKPTKIFSEPKRYIDVELMGRTIQNKIRILDDGSEKFDSDFDHYATVFNRRK